VNIPFMSNRLALLAALALPTAFSLAPAQAAALYPTLDPQPTAQAASPDTPVPPALYRSAFANLPAGVEQTSVDWKTSNAIVGQFPRGHADLLKWERAQEKAPGKTPEKAQPQPAESAPPSHPATPASPAPSTSPFHQPRQPIHPLKRTP